MTPPPATDLAAPEEVSCPRCGERVPAGAFCGACGGHLDAADPIRAHAYTLAPGEHLLQPSLVTSLFPHLPRRSRAPFRLALAAAGALLVVLALLRLQAPVVAVSALAIPLLFQLYVFEVDVYEDERWLQTLLTFGLGAALGVVWAYFTGPIVTNAITATFSGGLTHRSLWVAGILIPGGAQLVMLLPVALVWLRRRTRTESLDGFAVGAASAMGFVLTSVLTRLWPQLSGGIVASHRGTGSVVVQALLQGVSVPLVAGCASGLVAATWWLQRRNPVHGGRWATSWWPALLGAVAIQVGLGVTDLWQPPEATLLVVHLGAALVLLLALRVGLHFAVLHEQHEIVLGPPRICAHCHHIVPTLPFCPHCGAALRATSRRVRAALTVPAEESL